MGKVVFIETEESKKVKKLSIREKAYMAGFLDGDGSSMAQIIKRKDNLLKFGLRVSLSLTQSTRRQSSLDYIKEKIGAGNVRDRHDGVSVYELRDMQAVRVLLTQLLPDLKIKKTQAILAIQIAVILPSVSNEQPSKFLELCKKADKIASFNDSKKRTNTAETVRLKFIEQKWLKE